MAISLYVLGIAAVAYLFWRLLAVLQDPLSSLPGPFLARFTQLWCFQKFRRGHWEHDILALHRKYGPIVRYGPGQYSINDPDSIKTIHGQAGTFNKSVFYDPWSPPGTTSLFKEQDNRSHGQLRKRFAAIYSNTSVYAYEQGVTDCVELLCRRMEENAGKEIDLAWWIDCLAFDSIGIVTYGKRFGFLDEGKDVGNLAKAVDSAFTYGSSVGHFPFLHPYLIAARRFMAKVSKSKGTGKMYLDSFTSETVAQRRKDRFEDPEIAKRAEDAATSVLDKFLDQNEYDPAYFTDAHILMGLGANVTAGADTTAASASWALFYLAKNPHTLTKLREEISSRSQDGGASISLREAQEMPYLNAVIDETLRVFPQTGFGLPRVVPPGGTEICGRFFPAGSVVSTNAWAMHYDAANFENPDQFLPERWLTSDPKKRERMLLAYIPFGLGSRTCIGRHIAMLVMLKTILQFVMKFDYELVGGLKEADRLPTLNIFLVKATKFPAVLRPRRTSGMSKAQ